MAWSARAIDPALVDALKRDDKLLDQTLFGEQPPLFTEKLQKEHRVDFSDPRIRDEVQAWAAKRKTEVGDTEIDIDEAWHGIHYLLTGSADSNKTLASKVIMGGKDIGPDRGYGPAQLLMPAEVKAIAKLLEETTPEMLRARYKPKEMTRAGVYPGEIWARDGDEAMQYVLEYYKKLVAFYKLAALRGQAVILLIS
ncbi:MAG TPA: YfbM family protein [Steroidobacteraceae bacterium]